MKSHLDDHPLEGAFLANRMDRLADLIVAQGKDLLADIGLDVPPRAVSAILIIGESGAVSTADIAEMLGQQHQVTTQRIELLITDEIVVRTPDPSDRRRKLLTLTKKGREHYAALRQRLETAAQVFDELCEEVGCDLPRVLSEMAAALNTRSLLDRTHDVESRKSRRKTRTKGQ
ncbi:MAG: MarR family transcriptional regulator [Pseudomonadota bacterium]